ncbi:hypothetical protein KSW81_002216 [Nannochloris sp. 'desiccata']|nr:hypothetical protein KSW81_002216 [Chlorella desiccata (nom. nud.)]
MARTKRKNQQRDGGVGDGIDEVKLPKKAKYRQRAHSNPLVDAHFDIPLNPDHMNWQQEFPELYAEAVARGTPPPQVDFVDVGCGFGGLTVGLAQAYPDKLVCGMEIRQKVSEYVKERVLALRKKEPGKFRNATCIRTNTMKHITNYFKKGSLEKMFFLFPDPHFKEKNHRRRIIQRTLLAEYAYLMKPGGILYTITDVEDLGVWMREKLEAHPLFEKVPEAELEGDEAARLLEEGTEEGQKEHEGRNNHSEPQCPPLSEAMIETEVKAKLHAAEQAFERRLGVMETKLSQDLIEERSLREAAEKSLREGKELQEKHVAEAAEEKQNAVSAAVQELEQKLEKEQMLNIKLKKQIESMKTAWEAEKEAFEAEVDQEVLSAKTEADTLLASERATVQRLRGEAAVLKQRYEDQLVTAKFAESNAQQLSQQGKKLRTQVEGLVKDLARVKSELAARESAFEDKESMVRELTDRERALEMKCVALVDAREAANKQTAEEKSKASNLAQQVESLRGEYKSAQKTLKAAELAASSRKQRELAARKETAAQKEIVERLKRKLKTISGAIAEAGALIQQPAELKNAVVNLYHTYATDLHCSDQENSCGEESAATEKRDHQQVVESLKARIHRLQRQIQNQRDSNLAEARRAVSENGFLMKEIEVLEQKLEKCQKE